MTRYVDVTHAEWIAASVETVRTQFADLDHHIHRLLLEAQVRKELCAAALEDKADIEGCGCPAACIVPPAAAHA